MPEALSGALNEAQKSALAELETLCREDTRYALRFGFTRGVYVGFQQYFSKDPAEFPFEDYALALLTMPHMEGAPSTIKGGIN